MSFLSEFSGGSSLGQASGKITVDTTDFERSGQTVVSVSQNMERQVTSSAATMSRAWDGVATGLGVVATAGIAAATRVQSLEARFTAVSGGVQNATRYMDQLRQMADRTGQPFLQLVEGASSLLPAIRNSNGELEKTLNVAQRLALLDPAQGIEGASFAIREFLSGEYLSLTRRFELDRSTLREITQEANGNARVAIELLSDYIDDLGLTQDAMADLGQTGAVAFQPIRDEITLALSTAFEPMLNNFILPIARGIGDIARAAREAAPDLLAFGGAAAAVFGIPALASKLPGVGGFAPSVGTVARYAGAPFAVAGGAMLGAAATRTLAEQGAAPAELAGKSNLELLGVAVTTLVVTLVDGFGELRKIFAVFGTALQDLSLRIQEAGANFIIWLGEAIINLGSFLSRLGIDTGGMVMAGADLTRGGMETRSAVQTQRAGLGGDLAEQLADIDIQTQDWRTTIAESIVTLLGGEDALARFRGEVTDTAEAATEATQAMVEVTEQFSEDQVSAWIEYQAEIEQIEADAQTKREEIIASGAQRIADAEAQAAASQQAREEEAQIDLQNKRIELVQDAENKRMEIIAKYAREREKMERDHRTNLLDAAANLDARAVWREQRQYEDKQQEQADKETAELDQLDAHLTERLTKQETASQQRLEAQQRADNRRLEQLRAATDAETRQKLQQLDAQVRQELQLREQAFIATFNSLAAAAGQHQSNMINIQAQGQAAAEQALSNWWIRQQQRFAGSVAQASANIVQQNVGFKTTAQAFSARSSVSTKYAGLTDLPTSARLGGYQMPEFATGGFVPSDMIAKLHSGEYVLPADVVNQIAGGDMSSKSIGDVYVSVAGSNATAEQIGARVRQELADLFAGI